MEHPNHWAWHVHHNTLAERLSESIEIRQDYIRRQKPRPEVETRLRLLRIVKNQAVLEAYEAAKRSAREAYEAAKRSAWGAVETLHRAECSPCPWNGRTIFPKCG